MGALEIVQNLAAGWQRQLDDQVKVVLGGSLVSGLFIEEGAEAIDADVRFLTETPDDPVILAAVEQATGLHYRKTITVNDWPTGQSVGVMVEGILEVPDLALPVEVEGCIRNSAYVGWAKFYPVVLTAEELVEIRHRKIELRGDKAAYKAYKKDVLAEVQRHVLEQGLLD